MGVFYTLVTGMDGCVVHTVAGLCTPARGLGGVLCTPIKGMDGCVAHTSHEHG